MDGVDRSNSSLLRPASVAGLAGDILRRISRRQRNKIAVRAAHGRAVGVACAPHRQTAGPGNKLLLRLRCADDRHVLPGPHSTVTMSPCIGIPMAINLPCVRVGSGNLSIVRERSSTRPARSASQIFRCACADFMSSPVYRQGPPVPAQTCSTSSIFRDVGVGEQSVRSLVGVDVGDVVVHHSGDPGLVAQVIVQRRNSCPGPGGAGGRRQQKAVPRLRLDKASLVFSSGVSAASQNAAAMPPWQGRSRISGCR